MPAAPIKLTTQTLVAVAGSAAMGLALVVVGVRALANGSYPTLLGITLTLIGVLGIALGAATWYGRRAAWAILAATWGVVGFCAFFAAPKLVSLPKLEQVTIEMELKMGRKAAEEKVDDRNLVVRAQNLGVCTVFALPFVLLCAGLLTGGRELEQH
ncbi:MAG TPA: hypothetical protein VM261_23355 [Kofleriaceae bacterium]|nr:hypothetical protein [Kofleriaceae bacterium]